MTRPDLSICIPTYNRAAFLSQGLCSLSDQLAGAESGSVEVVISDNASTDSTQEVVRRVSEKNPHVRLKYLRQPKNLGASANVCVLPAHAEGEFVYLVSDDDVLLPGAVSTVLRAVRQHSAVDAVCPNVRMFRERPDEGAAPIFSWNEDRVVFGKDETLEMLSTFLTYLSCLVVRRERIAARDYRFRVSTDIPHSYMFLDALAPERGCVLLHQPCLAMRANDSVGYNLFEVFVTNFHAALEYAESLGFSQSTTQRVLRAHLGFLGGAIQHFREQGSYRPSLGDALEDVVRLLRVYPLRSREVARVVAMILLPRVMVRIGRRSWRLASRLFARHRPGSPA